MTALAITLAAIAGGLWRRWLGSEASTGRRYVKVVVGVCLAYAIVLLFRWEWTPLDMAFSATYAGAVVLIFVMGMDWRNLKWTAARWALSALPLAGLLGIDRHYIAAGLAPVVVAAAGLSWEATWRAPWAWPTLGLGHWLRGFSAYAEIIAGAIVFGFVAGAL